MPCYSRVNFGKRDISVCGKGKVGALGLSVAASLVIFGFVVVYAEAVTFASN